MIARINRTRFIEWSKSLEYVKRSPYYDMIMTAEESAALENESDKQMFAGHLYYKEAKYLYPGRYTRRYMWTLRAESAREGDVLHIYRIRGKDYQDLVRKGVAV